MRSPEKTADILRHQHCWFLREMTSEKEAQKFHTDDIWVDVVPLIGWSKFSTRDDQSEAVLRSGWWRVVLSMEFLRLFSGWLQWLRFKVLAVCYDYN